MIRLKLRSMLSLLMDFYWNWISVFQISILYHWNLKIKKKCMFLRNGHKCSDRQGLKEQSDQGLHCLPFHPHDMVKTHYSNSCSKYADGISHSVDPDQTAPLAVWSGSALFAQTYLSKNFHYGSFICRSCRWFSSGTPVDPLSKFAYVDVYVSEIRLKKLYPVYTKFLKRTRNWLAVQ